MSCNRRCLLLLVLSFSFLLPFRSARATLLTVEALEVTQALQTLEAQQSIPLIAGKPTVVRFYLHSREKEVSVRGWLRAENAAGDVLLVSSEQSARVHPAGEVDLARRRNDAELSLNFFLKPELVQEGPLSLRLDQVDLAARTKREIFALDGETERTVTIEADSPLYLALLTVPVQRKSRIRVPEEADLRRTESWLRRAYPAGQILVSHRSLVSGDPAFQDGFFCYDVNTLLLAARNLDVSSGVDPRTHYYGMLHRLSGLKNGCALGIPEPGETMPPVASGLNRLADLPVPDADWYAGHELAHTFGMRHTCADELNPCCRTCDEKQASLGQFVGWDAGDAEIEASPAVLPGDRWSDVMSYCPRPWLSALTYRAVRERLRQEARLSAVDLSKISPPAGLFVGPPDLTKTPYLNIVGFRASGSKRTVFYLLPLLLPILAPDLPAGLTVDVLGAPEVSRKVWGRVYQETCGGPVYFDVLVPMARGTTGVLLHWNGERIVQFAFGPEPPWIKNVHLGPANPKKDDGRVALTWEGGDPDDKKDIHFSVQQSRNGEGSWETIAVGLRETRLVLEQDPRQSSQETKLRILATDGFNVVTGEIRESLGGVEAPAATDPLSPN
jgi:hypothetical protein